MHDILLPDPKIRDGNEDDYNTTFGHRLLRKHLATLLANNNREPDYSQNTEETTLILATPDPSKYYSSRRCWCSYLTRFNTRFIFVSEGDSRV
jgi:hypothetical protein